MLPVLEKKAKKTFINMPYFECVIKPLRASSANPVLVVIDWQYDRGSHWVYYCDTIMTVSFQVENYSSLLTHHLSTSTFYTSVANDDNVYGHLTRPVVL